jgi:hypothetical protein
LIIRRARAVSEGIRCGYAGQITDRVRTRSGSAFAGNCSRAQ